MGFRLLDQFTLLHFSVGVGVYFWGMNLSTWVVIHILFEIIENTPWGMNFINNTITYWPGGKSKPDRVINSVGDTLGAICGWLVAKYLDDYGNRHRWYE